MWQSRFLWLCLFFGCNFLTLQYYVDWKSILPFTSTPSDLTLFAGTVLFLRFVFVEGTKDVLTLYARIKLPMLLLVSLVSISFCRSLSYQDFAMSLLSHRGWAYVIFFIVGYQLVDRGFTLSRLVWSLSRLSIVAGVAALFYALTFDPGSLARYYPQVIPLSGTFLIFHGIRVIRDHSTRDSWLLLFHLAVVILSQTRSLWITCIVGIVFAGVYLRKRIRVRRVIVQVALALLVIVFIRITGVLETAEEAVVTRLDVGKEDVEGITGSYALRVFAFLDVWDYLEESGPMVQLIGISDLHQRSPIMQSMIGYGRVMGYAGVVYRDAGVEETAYLENSVANILLAFGILGSCVMWCGVFYPLVLRLLLRVNAVRQIDSIGSAFLIAFSGVMLGQPVQYFFGVDFKGLELGLLLLMLGAVEKTIDMQGLRISIPSANGRD